MRHRALFLLLTLALSAILMAVPAGAQDDDIPDQCRTIIGCPDAGPKPEKPGDRG